MFLISYGFVQKGYSTSPVFLYGIHQNTTKTLFPFLLQHRKVAWQINKTDVRLKTTNLYLIYHCLRLTMQPIKSVGHVFKVRPYIVYSHYFPGYPGKSTEGRSVGAVGRDQSGISRDTRVSEWTARKHGRLGGAHGARVYAFIMMKLWVKCPFMDLLAITYLVVSGIGTPKHLKAKVYLCFKLP